MKLVTVASQRKIPKANLIKSYKGPFGGSILPLWPFLVPRRPIVLGRKLVWVSFEYMIIPAVFSTIAVCSLMRSAYDGGRPI